MGARAGGRVPRDPAGPIRSKVEGKFPIVVVSDDQAASMREILLEAWWS